MNNSTLIIGANTALRSSELSILLNANSSFLLDVFVLDESGGTMCALENSEHPSSRVSGLNIKVNPMSIDLDIKSLPVRACKLCFAISVEHGSVSYLSKISGIIKSNLDSISLEVDTISLKEKSLILFEIYKRNDDWKIKFVSQGFSGGVPSLDNAFNYTREGRFNQSSNKPVKVTPKEKNNGRFRDDEINSLSTNETGNSIMSILSKAKRLFSESSDAIQEEMLKFKNKTMLHAVVATSVYISAADGDISSDEKKKLMAYLERSKELKMYDKKDVIAIFNELADHFDFDVDIARGECMKLIVKLKGNEAQSQLLIQVATSIAKSDGEFDKCEEDAIAEIAKALGLNL